MKNWPRTDIELIVINGDSYTLETRECNKPRCKCHNGNPHGPYWYRNRTKYIGKQLPKNVIQYLNEIERTKEYTQKKIAHYCELWKKSLEQTTRYRQNLAACERHLCGEYVSDDDRTRLQLPKPPKD